MLDTELSPTNSEEAIVGREGIMLKTESAFRYMTREDP
jgi:hypothetical protein